MTTFWDRAAWSVAHMFSFSFVCLYVLFISHFGFKRRIWFLIAPVHVHCFSITFSNWLLMTMKWYDHFFFDPSLLILVLAGN